MFKTTIIDCCTKKPVGHSTDGVVVMSKFHYGMNDLWEVVQHEEPTVVLNHQQPRDLLNAQGTGEIYSNFEYLAMVVKNHRFNLFVPGVSMNTDVGCYLASCIRSQGYRVSLCDAINNTWTITLII